LEKKDDKKSINNIAKKASAKSYEDSSVGESGSLSQTDFNNIKKAKVSKDESSYSDSFDDVSASGSGSKSKLNYWPGKNEFNTKKQESSPSVS
jgi:hypothetical protein